MQMRGNLAVLESEDDLDKAGNTCRSLEVSDIGLHRTNQQRMIRCPSLA